MKKLTLTSCVLIPAAALAALLVISVGEAGAADSSACYSIGDADARTYCLARIHKEPSLCYAIQKPDARALCLAETRK